MDKQNGLGVGLPWAFRVEYSQKENPAFRRAMWSAIHKKGCRGRCHQSFNVCPICSSGETKPQSATMP